MKLDTSRSRPVQDLSIDVDAIAALIAENQLDSGEIPWCDGQKTDPWDHIEAAMGLSIGGYLEQARRAFKWFADTQLDDGSCYAAYLRGVVEDRTRETNLSSYLAVGVYHYYLITRDIDTLKSMWEPVSAAIDFALSLQTPEGEIYWAISPEGKIDKMALLTGCCSIYMSIKCALVIAGVLGYKKPAWESGLKKLGFALRHKPYLFNMTKSRFSMDWFYPVLTGVLTGTEAQKRIDHYWKKFVIESQGVKCVSDEPWVTIAETSELILALTAMDNRDLAKIVFNWISDKKYEDGSFWCGFTCPDIIIWPEDKIAWTNAVALMAADAIYNLTPAAQIFHHQFWNKFDFSS
jgi:hypothetical protein